ncbi:hypothetical protein R3W88_033410 [Solanum pinnatisectum]|uniref:Uncharacterized protein n=1 Tax=Solanum pinnatisectum TaxID=50273 RepID=A0AAV9K241_9SOLN|nr:hypothetical protein R3W88_033410 [Solanum pinnatisectum]
MAREPPVGTVRPPNQAQQERLNQTNKTHHQPPSNSSYNSVNLRNNEAMNSANSQREIEAMNTKEDVQQAGKYTNSNHKHSAINWSSGDSHKQVAANLQKVSSLNDSEQRKRDYNVQGPNNGTEKGMQSQQATNEGNTDHNNYYKEFPKISSNFDRHKSNDQKNQQTKPHHRLLTRHSNEGQNNKQDQHIEPAPYTVVQTLAARLRQVHAAHADPIELVAPRHTTKQGQPIVIYDMDDFMNKLAVDCKYNLIGKFSATMPKQMNRKKCINTTTVKGTIKNTIHSKRKKDGKHKKGETLTSGGCTTKINMETYLTTKQADKGAPNKHNSTNREGPFNTGRIPPQETQNRRDKKQDKIDLTRHKGCKDNMKNSGIDSMLPTPVNPNIGSMVVTCNDEAEGGMEGGCQENHTNLQEGVWIVTTIRPQNPATTKTSQRQVKESTNSATNYSDISISVTKVTTIRALWLKTWDPRLVPKREGTPKSKNKPSKKKRDAAKKKQNMQQEGVQQGEQEENEETPPDKEQTNCQLNSIPIIDEYAVINSEDELDEDNQSFKEQDDEEETSEMLIRSFSPNYDQVLENEIQQVTDKQGLSPRGFHHDRFHFKNQDINTVTTGRPNTRLFTSKSSQ